MTSVAGVAGVPATAGGFVLPGELRATMRRHAAGVAVITTRDKGPVGFCATSLTSVSLEPPTVSFGVAMGSTSGRAWRGAAYGIVHLLGSDQADVAAAFSVTGPEKFAGPVGWRWGPGGQPLLDGVLAWMLVSTRTRLVVGDHLLIVADVRETAIEPGPGAGPLVHCDGRFLGLP
ncbi:flavin reductase family protein [Nonomuraea sp. M3C6]|uniref:Flavin reductase family protein n=1 Tax=Nonomuraea marmarensis TaxID=3351344 RepID=A0ABW7ADV3_9ACTN